MNSNYKFEDGITVNADSIERAKEKHSKVVKWCKILLSTFLKT